MMDLYKLIGSSILLIFISTLFCFYKKDKSKRKTSQKKYPSFFVNNFSSQFTHFKYTKEGDLINFKCEGKIEYKGESFCLENFLLNEYFYQINYLNYINKKCRETKKVGSQKMKKN